MFVNIEQANQRKGAHDGLVDAYNTALLFAKLRLTPDYKLNEHYLPHPEHLSFSFGDKLAGLNLASA